MVPRSNERCSKDILFPGYFFLAAAHSSESQKSTCAHCCVKKIDETITIHKQCSCCMCERTSSCCCCYCMCDSPAVNPELAVETLLSHVPSLWI